MKHARAAVLFITTSLLVVRPVAAQTEYFAAGTFCLPSFVTTCIADLWILLLSSTPDPLTGFATRFRYSGQFTSGSELDFVTVIQGVGRLDLFRRVIDGVRPGLDRGSPFDFETGIITLSPIGSIDPPGFVGGTLDETTGLFATFERCELPGSPVVPPCVAPTTTTTTVPEPATIWLLATGLAATGVVGFRRRREVGTA